MQLTRLAIWLVQYFASFNAKPQQVGSKYVIGYEHFTSDEELVKRYSEGDGISKDEALELLAKQIGEQARRLKDLVRVKLSLPQMTALVLFAFREPDNLVASGLIRQVNQEDAAGVIETFFHLGLAKLAQRGDSKEAAMQAYLYFLAAMLWEMPEDAVWGGERLVVAAVSPQDPEGGKVMDEFLADAKTAAIMLFKVEHGAVVSDPEEAQGDG